ncbi:cellulose biosynthesis protein BcsE [Chromobacterium sp. ATCC 53434]|uniref:cellulose biosynthesis protein BcsE n=1 Tax=Chromobacterium sp. (strain ATCC 53434 / SC 14030) TaxID=2059672 RepID=UPI000C783D70|nr:cellulose biosynthesis protein BcsE [Chromobacterium sp. ATCC 53434]AUH50822.1 cellulose biosynthesis protein BcsE [Chromobacterium sp. ATCC 53434]
MDISQSLGIEGIPPSASALNGGALYLIAAPGSGLAQALLFSNLPSAGSQPLVCASRQEPAPQQDTAWLDRRIHAGNLQLLSPRQPRKPSAQRVTACLDELARCRDALQPATGGMTVVLDHAEDYLPLQQPAVARRVLQACSHWAARHGHALLLLLDSARLDAAALAALSQLGRDCAGMAYAEPLGDGLYGWQTAHWLGAAPGEAARLRTLELNVGHMLRAQLEADDHDAPADAAESPARLATDTMQVLATIAALSGNTPPTPHWRLFDDLPQLLEAAHDAVAATVLLDSAGSTKEALGQAVSQLRRQSGKRLKIVVREVGNRRLRQNEEQLLLRLGANAVLPAELRFTSLAGIVHSLRQAVYQGGGEIEADALRAASRPEADRGYLPPARFVEMADAAVQRSRAIDVSNMLIQLQPALGATPAELLALGRFQRAGDLCTADRDHAYLFLFACRENDADAALGNLFRMPIGEVAQMEVRSADSDSILLALSQLARQPGFDKLPDLSLQLSQAPHQRERRHAYAAPVLQRTPLRRRGDK